MTEPKPKRLAFSRGQALILLGFMPLFFSSNIIFGRAAVDEVAPFTIAFLRWSLTASVLLLFVAPTLREHARLIRHEWRLLTALGFLGMFVCGGVFYLALKYTTATNGTLIYTSSPVLIIVLEALFRNRRVGVQEAAGVAIAIVGVAYIVFRGSWAQVAGLDLSLGDAIAVLCAVSWALYSVILKSDRLAPLQTFPLFALVALAGSVLLLPFMAAELATGGGFPASVTAWGQVVGIVIVASLLAFSAYQIGVAIVGPSTTGIFLYLLPVYGVSLAVVFLGERLSAYHLWGIGFVLGGVILATWPRRAKPVPV